MSAVHLKLLNAARAGALDPLKQQLQQLDDGELSKVAEGGTGLTPLHLAAAGGYDECVEALLEAGADPLATCGAQHQTPLHSAAQSAIPMCAYQLASRAPKGCLQHDAAGSTPIDLAVASEKGEVLNALLLACSNHATEEALASMRGLLAAGAVCDTWAPNGSSALMLAASVDCAAGVLLLLDNAASLELQDALGRTALMFAAGNNARVALEALLDRGASVSIRDRRGRNVVDYAAADSEVRRVLQERIAEMESKAARLQEELLAELLDDEAQHGKGGSKKSKKKKGKQAKAKPAAAPAAPPAAAAPAAAPVPSHAADEGKMLQPEQPEQAGQEPDAPAAAAIVAALMAAAKLVHISSSDDEQAQTSSEWQVVGRRKREDTAHVQLTLRHLGTSCEGGPVKRCPSASSLGSLGSSCSGESHDTAGSSQRSVLIPPSRSSSAARNHLGTKPATVAASKSAPAPQAKPAWGKPLAAPAQSASQQQLHVPPAVHGIDDDAAYPLLAPPGAEQHQKSAAEQCSSSGIDSCVRRTVDDAAKDDAAGAVEAAAAPGDGASGPPPPAVGASAAPPLPASLPGTSPSPLAPLSQLLAMQQGGQDAAELAVEVATLRAEVAQLRLRQQQTELMHQDELASVLDDTAAHEATAVAQAVAAERLQCIYRFAAFLQNNHLAADLLGGQALAAAARGFPDVHAATALAPQRQQQQPSLDFLGLGFPLLDARRLGAAGKAAPHVGPTMAVPLLNITGTSVASSPPLFFADLEQRLRTEYSGDVSHFVVPATEAQPAASLPMAHF